MKKAWVRILISAGIAVLLSVGVYIFGNIPFAVGGGSGKYFFIEDIIQRHFDRRSTLDDAFFINVSWDKQLIGRYDRFGEPHGVTDITDRAALTDLLTKLKASDTYKYICLDIRFEDGLERDSSDTQLFSLIRGMRDLVIPVHRGMTLADPTLEPKAASGDYRYTGFNTGFSRYQYLQKGKESMALRAYHDLTGKTITRRKLSPFFTCDGKLCSNVSFVRLPVDMSKKWSDSGDSFNYYDLGYDLGIYNMESLARRAEGKVVVIGNFVEDMHETYMGRQPGPYINYIATENLLGGTHFVNWSFIIMMLIVYFVLAAFAIDEVQFTDLIPALRNSDNRFVKWFISFLGITSILSIISTLIFILTQGSYNILIPSLFFSWLDNYLNKDKI